uniref:Tnp_zf-ribbon_2 domain-containing protein n=1 Tax=Rhabditophanes sp. KR3021 TaxID=114890 RepID=A0AC35TY57_9BILA
MSVKRNTSNGSRLKRTMDNMSIDTVNTQDIIDVESESQLNCVNKRKIGTYTFPIKDAMSLSKEEIETILLHQDKMKKQVICLDKKSLSSLLFMYCCLNDSEENKYQKEYRIDFKQCSRCLECREFYDENIYTTVICMCKKAKKCRNKRTGGCDKYRQTGIGNAIDDIHVRFTQQPQGNPANGHVPGGNDHSEYSMSNIDLYKNY